MRAGIRQRALPVYESMAGAGDPGTDMRAQALSLAGLQAVIKIPEGIHRPVEIAIHRVHWPPDQFGGTCPIEWFSRQQSDCRRCIFTLTFAPIPACGLQRVHQTCELVPLGLIQIKTLADAPDEELAAAAAKAAAQTIQKKSA
jgi:hypothetical protein